MKDCPICGNSYEVTTSKRYCSDECFKEGLRRWRRERRRKGIKETECVICGQVFLPESRRIVTCSEKC